MSLGVLTGYAAGGSQPASGGGIAPAAITGFTATVISTTRVDLAWDEATAADGYRVEDSLDGVTFDLLANLSGIASTSYSATGLTPGTHYWFRVRGTGSADGAWSTVLNRYTLPGQVLSPAANAISASEIDLTCAALSPAPTGYQWWISPDNTTFTLKGTTVSPAFNDTTGLLASTIYYYKARATNPAGVGAYSSVVNATTLAGTNTQAVSLTAAYDFDGNGTDGTGRGNTATLVSSPATVTGKVGTALYCTGGSNITIPDSADTRIGGGLDWTLVFWVKPDSVAAGVEWWAEKGNPASGASHEFYIQRSGGDVFFYVNGSLTAIHTTEAPLVAGEWNFVRVRYTNSTGIIELRVNQAGAFSATVGAITAQAQQTRIGKISGNNASSAFDCWKLWHRVLTDTEVSFEAHAYLGRSVAETLVASPVAPTVLSTLVLAQPGDGTFVGFCDLYYWKGRFYGCWRESAVHTYTPTGKIRVKSSADFVTWTSEALLSSPHATHDLAGAYFFERAADDRLALLCVSRTTTVYQTMLFTSADGTVWTGVDCTVAAANDWLWRPKVDPASGHFYSIGYPALAAGNPRLYTSTDAETWTTVVDPVVSEVVNETDLCFLSDGSLVALGRKDQSTSDRWGVSTASPWSSWTWRSTIPTLPAAALDSQYESPVLAPQRGDGSIYGAGRIPVSAPTTGQRTALAAFSSPLRAAEELISILPPLGTGGESGYPGIVFLPSEPGNVYALAYEGPGGANFAVKAVKIALLRTS